MATHIDLGIGLRCIQYLLVAFNFLFALSGILLVLTALMVAEPLSHLTPLLERQFLSPGLLLGTAGVAVVIASCLGIWGALRQSTALVTLFSFVMSVLLLLELGAGLSAFLMQDGLRHVLTENIKTAMQRYDFDPDTRAAIDKMQSGLHCCGVNGPSSWQDVRGHEFYLPASCCGIRPGDSDLGRNGSAEAPCTMDLANDGEWAVAGCLPELGTLILRGSAFIASTAIVTAFTQFLGILFACTLGRSIRQQKTLRDMRRHQLQDNLINSYSPLDTKPMPPITITY